MSNTLVNALNEQDRFHVPVYQIIANGVDVTANIKPYFESLSLTDNDKDESDELTLVLSAKFQRPSYGDELKVFLGWQSNDSLMPAEPLKFAGKFYVQKCSVRDNRKLTISATGVNLKTDIKVRKSITHEGTLQEVVDGIAKGHNYQLKTNIDLNIKGIWEQTNESDMSFLNRIAKASNAIFNIKNDTVYFVEDRTETIVPSISVDLDLCFESEITYSNKSQYSSCVAKYHDTKTNTVIEGKAGSGDPQLVIEGKYLSADEASRAASSALKRASAAQIEGTLKKRGEVVFAGSILTLINENQRCNINRVTHTLDSAGWKTELEFKSVGS